MRLKYQTNIIQWLIDIRIFNFSSFKLLLEEYSNKDLSVLLADKTIIAHCTFVIHAFRISTWKVNGKIRH